MGNQIGGNIIRAFEAGRKAKMDREQMEIQAQERKLRLDLLEDEKKKIKRQEQIQKFQLLRGTQGEQVPGLPSQPGTPIPFQGQDIPGSGMPTPGVPPGELQHAPIDIEPGFSLRPENRGELQQMKFQDALNAMGIKGLAAQQDIDIEKRKRKELPKFTNVPLGAGAMNEFSGEMIREPQPKQDMSISETELFIKAAQGDPIAQAALKLKLDQVKAGRSTTGGDDRNKKLSVTEAKALGVPYGTTRGEAEGKVFPDKPMISAKEAQLARGKLLAVKVAKAQLQTVKDQFLKAKAVIGPIMGGVPGAVTESGSNYDAAIDSLRQAIIGLTRTPGIGQMSDFETRLSQAQLPERTAGAYESSIKLKIASLESMMNTLEQGYNDILQMDSGEPSTPSGPPPGATHIAPGSDGKNHYTNAQGQDLGVAP